MVSEESEGDTELEPVDMGETDAVEITDCAEFTSSDPTDVESEQFGDGLADLAIDVDLDAVEAVRDLRGDR